MSQLTTKFIANNAVTNAKAAQMAAHTFKGNNTGSTANSIDLTATQLTAELIPFVGDSGSGGTQGLVPAPSAGDTAAGKFLSADGTFAVPSGTGITQLTGDVTAGPGSGSQAASLVATSNATLTTLSALTTASALASVGTITSGTWNATSIAPTHGGTGISTYTTGDTLYASASNVLSKLGIGSSGNVLTVVAGVPAWQAPNSANKALSNLASVAINTSLLPGVDNTIDVGGAALRFNTIYGVNISGGTGTGTISMTGELITDSLGNTSIDWGARQLEGQFGIMLDWSGNGYLDVNGNKIQAVGDPTTAQDAANKGYVDGQITGLGSVYLALAGGTMTGSINMGSSQINNMADPSSAQDAATKHYVDNLVAGLSWKEYVRAASVANVSVSSAPASIDGVTLSSGDRILLKDQTTGSQNGIYIFNGTGSALTRSTDMDSWAEVVSAVMLVSEGSTNTGTKFVNTNVAGGTLGSTAITFVAFSIAGTVNGTGTTNYVAYWSGTATLTAEQYLSASRGGLGADASGFTGVVKAASGVFSASTIVNADIDAAAAIAYSKLALSNSIQLGDMTANSVDENKIVSTTISTTGALNGGSGTKISARVDSTTVKINGSNNLESLKETEQQITLSGTDITNQYVDLSHAIYGTSASVNSASLFAVGGPMQQKTVDYTVSLTGGSGGVTRITFAGDLATGGPAALVASDILVIKYSFLT